MRIIILPCIGTNQAVAEIEDGVLPVEIRSPRKLEKGEVELLLWRLYQDVCGYRWMLDPFKHLAYLAVPWALASGLAVYYRLSGLFEISGGYMILYGWTALWLLADGLWCALQVATKTPQWWRARKAFKSLAEPWTAKVVRDGWLAAIETRELSFGMDWVEGLVIGQPERHDRERVWIEFLQDDERYGHLYTRLLKRYPPRVMDFAPVGIWRHLRRMMLGVPVREPWYCYEIGK